LLRSGANYFGIVHLFVIAAERCQSGDHCLGDGLLELAVATGAVVPFDRRDRRICEQRHDLDEVRYAGFIRPVVADLRF